MIYGPIPYFRAVTIKYNFRTIQITHITPYEMEMQHAWYCIAYQIPDNSYVFLNNTVSILTNDLFWINKEVLKLACEMIFDTNINKQEDILVLQRDCERRYCSDLEGYNNYKKYETQNKSNSQ